MTTQAHLSRAALLTILGGVFVSATESLSRRDQAISAAAIPGSAYRFDRPVNHGVMNEAGASPGTPAASAILPAEGARVSTDQGTRSFFVLSNSTSFAVGPESGFIVKRLRQEPFAANRPDLDAEPSNSLTTVELTQGPLSIATGQLAQGSELRLETPDGVLSGRGDTRYRLALEAKHGETIVTLLEGTLNLSLRDSNAWSEDTLRPEQQAILRSPAPGRSGDIQVRPLTPSQRARWEQPIRTASHARKKIYFEIGTPAATSGAQLTQLHAIKVFSPEPEEAGNLVNRARKS